MTKPESNPNSDKSRAVAEIRPLRPIPSFGFRAAAGVRLSAFAILQCLLWTLGSPSSCPAAQYESCRVTPPKPEHEFRAAWVATVANIDWPSAKGLSTADQKSELLRILDRAAQLKLNAIILQVRPACDALYASPIEPWSEYLTGVMGQAPQPYYDPLAFAVEEAHKRGLELHAWFNPYRARLLPAKTPASANHISKTHPELVRQYGKYLWLDPGEKQVQDYSLSVIMDVVKRYDVDGIHFDDYFYPYKETNASGNEIDFPDAPSWQRFGARGKLGRDDWRRENVNAFIERVYRSIKAAKPWVKFGISPFGIWQPGNPPVIRGFNAYDKLYADSRKWLAKGWVDYFAPQLYWAIDSPEQSFPALLKWWAAQNAKGRHLTPGLASTKTAGKWQPEEIVRQIRLTRAQPGASGDIHWDMKSLMRSGGLGEALQREVYAEPALQPASFWLSGGRPGKPRLAAGAYDNGSACAFDWTPAEPGRTWLWLVQTRTAGRWTTEVLPATRTSQVWKGALPEVMAVSAVDRNGNTSSATAVQLRK